jgi:hypothetical protein
MDTERTLCKYFGLAHGALFATGELVYVQDPGNKPGEAGGGL